MQYAVEEQMRGLAGPFISLIQRGEHLKNLMGISHLLGLLTTVFLVMPPENTVSKPELTIVPEAMPPPLTYCPPLPPMIVPEATPPDETVT